MRSSLASWFVILCCLSSVAGCRTLRGRADDALERGDYRRAVELYTQLHTREPNDAKIAQLLTRAERGLLDQVLGQAESARHGMAEDEALKASLEVMMTKDRMHAGTIDPPRAQRVGATVEWATSIVRASVRNETSRGRALAARARRGAVTPWLERPELARVGPELDAEIAAAGSQTCLRATQTATGQPFALELVASYCKEVGGPMPAWMPRPFLVGGATISGTITGTPATEQVEIERAVTEALERSVWFTATTTARANVQVQGSIVSLFSREPTELTRSWMESVPYEATETYTEAVAVPYIDTETYTESVPFTAYEERSEPCRPPRRGMCTVSRKVTRYRDETRTREVRRVRTEYQERTRQVTRYREEARVFRYQAMKHSGRYQSSFFVRLDLGGGLRPIEARGSAEDSRVAHEHDAEFAPAGVHPERASLPSGLSWREGQRAKIRSEILKSLDDGWRRAFCNEGVGTIEEAARCAHARPTPEPSAVRARVQTLFGDDPDRILALPRPGEAIH